MTLEHDESALEQAQTLPWYHDIDPGRQEIVVNLIFNMGLQSFLDQKNMIAVLQRCENHGRRLSSPLT